MNASMKKLLSMLVVMAMVISMVPTFTLPAIAAETEPASAVPTEAQAAIAAGKEIQEQANAIQFPEAGGNFEAYCPACKETVTWKSKTVNIYAGLFADTIKTLDNTNDHIYLIAPTAPCGSLNLISTNGLPSTVTRDDNLCIHLNGQDITISGRMFINRPITLNIMGEGSITSDGRTYENNAWTEPGTRTSTYGIFQVTTAAKINLYGGTYDYAAGAQAVAGSATYATLGLVTAAGAEANIYNDVVLKATGAANVGLHDKAVVNMYGGTIQDGDGYNNGTYVDGGNVYLAGGSTFNMYGGTIKNGETVRAGGNVALNGTAKFNMYDGAVTGGHTTGTNGSGGNISATSNGIITIAGGTVSGGYNPPDNAGASWGGNIRAWNATVNVSGGYIYGGGAKNNTSNHLAANIGCMGDTADKSKLNISGGNIAGDILITNSFTTVKLSGTPKIMYRDLPLADGTTVDAIYQGMPVSSNAVSQMDISELQPGAQIQLTGNVGTVFTKASENAANVEDCFTSTAGSSRVIKAQADNTLKIVEHVEEPTEDKFEPEKFNGEAYCPVCKDFKTWTAYDGTNNNDDTALKGDSSHYHLYLDKDWTYSANCFLWTYRKVCFNLNGHDVTAVAGASAAFGASSASTINLIDTEGGAVVTGYKNSASNGATLQVAGGNAASTINIYGGTYTKLASDTASPIVMISNNGGTINMYGGTIDATGKSVASNGTGCAVTLRGSNGKNAVFNMEGGEIKGGNAVQGGAVMVGVYSTEHFDCAIFNLKGGKISGGTVSDINTEIAGAGGNFSVQYGGTLNISGGTLCNGTVTGNTNGASWGGNVRAYNGNVNISGGLIYGGTGGKNITGANVSVFSDATGRAAGRGKLTISGGTIVGDVAVSNGIGSGFLTLSGAPKIVTSMEIEGDTVNAVSGGLHVSGYTADISGLSAEADIALSAALNVVLTDAHENAANVAGCFKPVNAAYTVEKQANNTLKVVEVPVAAPELDVFDPWNFGGMAYCPVCYANGKHTEPVEWIAITSSTAAFRMTADAHYYVAENITNASRGSNDAYIQGSYGNTTTNCLNLNGKQLTVTDGRALFAGTSVFNIMDTGKTGVVSGNLSSTGNACALLLNSSKAGAVVNIYGGTFTKPTTNTTSSIVSIQGNGGTINMYGGCIDGTGRTTTTYPTGVYMVGGITDYEGVKNSEYFGPAVFNMYGGEIKGGSTTRNGGNILVGDNSGNAYRKNAATFNMYGGTISGGTVAADDNNLGGGNISLTNGSVMNMSGGTVKDGVAGIDPATGKKTNAGNILVNADCVLNMSGDAKVINGTAGNQAGNIRVWKGDLNMSGNAEISGGTAYASNTHNVWLVCSDMTMTDNAVVYGIGTNTGNAINVSAYGAEGKNDTIISTLTLSGNATVKNKEGNSNNSILLGWTLHTNADTTDDACGKLMIDNGWTGEAYFYTQEHQGVAEGATKPTMAAYTRGATVDNAQAVCGELQEDGSIVKGGSFTGKLYYSGPVGTVGSNGDVTIGVASVVSESGETWYMSNQEAVDAAAGNADVYAMIHGNTTVELKGDTYIESRGYTVTVNGTGTLYTLDRANDDYVGYGLWKVADTVTVAEEATNPDNGNRYITIKSDGGYTAHRVEIQLSAVTLRAPAAGLYYKAQYKCDDVLAGRVMGYGVALSTDAMPGEDFLSVNEFTMYDGSEFNPEDHTVNTTSGSVFGILKEPGTDGRTKEENSTYAQMEIYANPYLAIDMDGTENLDAAVYFLGDNKNGGKTAADADFDGIAFSLLEVLDAIDNKWNEAGYLSDAQKELVEDYVNIWASWITTEAQTMVAGLLTNILA